MSGERMNNPEERRREERFFSDPITTWHFTNRQLAFDHAGQTPIPWWGNLTLGAELPLSGTPQELVNTNT